MDQLFAAAKGSGSYNFPMTFQAQAGPSNQAYEEQDDNHEEEEDESRPRKKRGRKPVAGAAERRKEQNRAAQRTFRVRKDEHLRNLEAQVEEMNSLYSESFRMVERLSADNNELRALSGQGTSDVTDLVRGTIMEPLFLNFQGQQAVGAAAKEVSKRAASNSESDQPSSSTAKRRASKYDVVPTFFPVPVTSAPPTSYSFTPSTPLLAASVQPDSPNLSAGYHAMSEYTPVSVAGGPLFWVSPDPQEDDEAYEYTG